MKVLFAILNKLLAGYSTFWILLKAYWSLIATCLKVTNTPIKICVQHFKTGAEGHSKGLKKAARSFLNALQKLAEILI